MKNLFQNKARLFFLHKNAKPQTEGVFEVILSPQYYWVKKVSLPVKRVGEAKKLAESVFEGSLPEGNYSYEVIASDDGEFILIAYDRDSITEELEKVFTQNAKVQGVRFAQYECKDLDECCSIDDDTSLVNLNGLLVQIPRNCTDPKLKVQEYIRTIKPSSHKVKLGTLDVEVMDKRTFVYLAAAVTLFAGAFLLEYVDYKKETGKLEETKQTLVQKYNLPATTMQLKSIQNRLTKLFHTQKKMRDILYAISKLPLLKDEYISNLDIDTKTATVEFSLKDANRAAVLKGVLSKRFKVLESREDDQKLKVKIAV